MSSKLIFETPIKLPASSPAQPEAGDLYFDGNNLIFNNGTLASPVGSSSSGEINLVSSIAGEWVVDNIGTTVVAESSATNMPLGEAGGMCFYINTDGNANTYYDFEIPEALKNTKLKIEFWQKPGITFGDLALEMFSYDNSNRNVNVQQYPLSTDNNGTTFLPNATQKVVATFDTDDRTYYRLRFGGFGVACQVYIQGMIVGPGKVATGVPKGMYEAVTSYTIGATTTAPTPGAGATYYRETYRDDSWAIIRYEFRQTSAGSDGSGDYLFPLPSGLNIDYTRISKATPDTPLGYVGDGYLTVNTSTCKSTALTLNSGSYANKIIIQSFNDTQPPFIMKDGSGGLANATIKLSFTVRVPIAEWADGSVYLGSNDVEEASNDGSAGTSAGQIYTTGMVKGRSRFPAVDSTTDSSITQYKVTFSTPYQRGDKVELIFYDDNLDGIADPRAMGIGDYTFSGGPGTGGTTKRTGMAWNSVPNDPYSFYVNFGNRGTDAYNQGAWSNFSSNTNRYWALRKTRGGVPVSFGAATETSMGLVKSGSGNFPVTLTGPRSAPITVYYQKTDKSVTLTWTGSASAVSSSAAPFVSPAGAVPDGLRPVSDLNVVVVVQDSGSVQSNPGRMIISAAGTITIYKDNTTASFANSGNCGFYTGSVTYVSAT